MLKNVLLGPSNWMCRRMMVEQIEAQIVRERVQHYFKMQKSKHNLLVIILFTSLITAT